jgi:inner membrane protein
MLIFAHTGIALGAAAVISAAANRHEKKPWLASLSKYMDIRFLIIGSMLPDIIDKPVGHMFFSNGRIFSHTLLFLVVVTIIGLIVYKRNKSVWGFSLAAGVLTHLVLDSMWVAPRTLFWPFMGWVFEKENYGDYLHLLFQLLLSDRVEAISEVIGLIITVWFSLAVIRRKQVVSLIKTGKVH